MGQDVIQKIGKYEIVAELGQGGMGVVYKARDPFIGRLVALKTITPELVTDPEILRRFYREAQAAGTLQHPNIVTIYDLGEADGRPYIAMEFVEGESLQNIIDRQARIPLAAKLKVVQQFCEGLAHAHKRGFVHRDVKPANILVTNDGSVKVVDFGIVHLESTNLTKAGTFLGTIHYASPEQVNDDHIDNRSDLWSVTCVIYEFIAYKKAFDGSNVAAIVAKVLSAEPEPLSRCCPGVPVDLDTVISRGLKKHVDERYQSLDELLLDLLPVASGLQQSFIGDLLVEAQDLREQGDFDGAQEKVRAVLILDSTRPDAKRLHTEISAELRRLAPGAVKARKLAADAEQAMGRGEYGEALRILGEAEGLNPADTQVRNLKSRVLEEQTRLHDVRDALTSGQRAMKQGDLTGAEQDFHRALQLDQNNQQASELLGMIQQDRMARERDFRLKEGLWQADNLVFSGSYREAQNRLLALRQDFPDSDEIQLKLRILDHLVRAENLAEEGEQALGRDDYEEALWALTEALRLDPENAKARELRTKAAQARERQMHVQEVCSAGEQALQEGDAITAETAFRRVLELDPCNARAASLLDQMQTAATDPASLLRQRFEQAERLVGEGKLDDAQFLLLEMQFDYPDVPEIAQRLMALDQSGKLAKLMADGQKALDQKEYGEAVRIFSEAQNLDPANATVRELRERALQERDRLRQTREAITAGQRAFREGQIGDAEREYQRALELDPANTQATNLLTMIRRDRLPAEREEQLRECLQTADGLLAAARFEEAHRLLLELFVEHPNSEEVVRRLQFFKPTD